MVPKKLGWSAALLLILALLAGARAPRCVHGPGAAQSLSLF